MPYTTTWNVGTYTSADDQDPAVWYSRKNKKEEGLAIGTVISIFRDRTGNWGDLSGGLNSRYPGWVECNGATVNAADYPDLFNAIGNTYGGDGQRVLTGNSYTYSGSFKLPNYRLRKLFGIGNVDGNSAASPIVTTYKGPDVNAAGTGDGTTVGSTGGNWFIKKYDAQGTPPDEQVYQGSDPPDGMFFKLGTLSTKGTDKVTGEVAFNITGNFSGEIGPLKETVVIMPPHEHEAISAEVQDVAVGCLAWGSPGFYQVDANEPGGDASGEIGNKTFPAIGYNSVIGPGGDFNKTYTNYWPGTVQNNLPGLPGGGTYSAAIDVTSTLGSVAAWQPGEQRTHSHYIQQTPYGSNPNVYGWGNVNGGGTASGGIAQNTTTTINFTQTEIAIGSNEATFTLNPSKKVLPTPSLVPENTIPLLTKYYRVKYIIKVF
jgi:hypothetical protein